MKRNPFAVSVMIWAGTILAVVVWWLAGKCR